MKSRHIGPNTFFLDCHGIAMCSHLLRLRFCFLFHRIIPIRTKVMVWHVEDRNSFIYIDLVAYDFDFDCAKGTSSLFLSPLSRELNTDTCPCQYFYSNALHPETNIKLLLSTDFVNHSLSLSLSLSLNNVIIHRSRFMQPLSLSLSLSFSISLSLSQQCYNT